ncbi:MAG: alpha-1,2-fucosyltransferase [Synergistaceae bacterium]|nr:alpha-1,2-fucosyltransferase [Synergistaceae bacterium]
MIITCIIPYAGIGNQMFMYAGGLAAAQRLNAKLALAPRSFDNVTREGRPYQLNNFPAITENFASFWEFWKISPRNAILDFMDYHYSYTSIKRYQLFRRLMRKILLKCCAHSSSKKIYKPSYSSYSPEFENIQDNTYMIGYWESEKIFSNISDLVRKKFKFADSCFNPELTAKIKSCNSVALHVRRSDKLNHEWHWGSNENYIRAAIEKIYSLTDNPEFFVFSDDIDYCRENLPKIYPDAKYNFISQTPAQDMALITICKHVITAPSTFSWWGAWLNENPRKIIIAPDINLWYKDLTPEIIADRKYLLPESWIKIN